MHWDLRLDDGTRKKGKKFCVITFRQIKNLVEVKFVWQISRPPWEWCEFGQVFKTGLLPNGPKWANSENILVRII